VFTIHDSQFTIHNSQPIIRPLTLEDVPAVAAIMAGNELWQRYGVTVDSAARRLQRGLAAGATIAVAVIDGRVAGFAWYVTEGAFQRSGYIMLFAVAPDAHGAGYRTRAPRPRRSRTLCHQFQHRAARLRLQRRGAALLSAAWLRPGRRIARLRETRRERVDLLQTAGAIAAIGNFTIEIVFTAPPITCRGLGSWRASGYNAPKRKGNQ
jgi:GNAT superfamily N-acetyltransferase